MQFVSCRAVLVLAALPLAVSLAACNQPAPPPAPAPAAAPALSPVERGEKLVIGGGCHDCHTPKKIGANGPEADLSCDLHRSILRIKTSSYLPHRDAVRGFIYDVTTGRLTEVA